MKKWTSIFLLGLLALAAGCKKETNPVFTEPVGIYMIDDYSIKTGKNYEIDNNSIGSFYKRIVYFDEIVGYDSATHTFTVNNTAINRIHNMNVQVSGAAFSVNVKDKVIYTGYFYPGSSPVHFDCIACDADSSGNELHMQYGYPAEMTAPVPDPRNDTLLISVLKDGNKLTPPKK